MSISNILTGKQNPSKNVEAFNLKLNSYDYEVDAGLSPVDIPTTSMLKAKFTNISSTIPPQTFSQTFSLQFDSNVFLDGAKAFIQPLGTYLISPVISNQANNLLEFRVFNGGSATVLAGSTLEFNILIV